MEAGARVVGKTLTHQVLGQAVDTCLQPMHQSEYAERNQQGFGSGRGGHAVGYWMFESPLSRGLDAGERTTLVQPCVQAGAILQGDQDAAALQLVPAA